MVEFDELVVERGGLRVTWEWIGEGCDGDYNTHDPKDVPLLRFSVDRVVKAVGGTAVFHEGLEDASYCTQMPVGTSEEVLLRAAALLLEAARMEYSKRRFEQLSWMSPKDFKGRGKWRTR